MSAGHEEAAAQAASLLETERMRLVACGVAAMANTVEARGERLARDHPCYSASYGDVCNAVDREMTHRGQLDKIVEIIGGTSRDNVLPTVERLLLEREQWKALAEFEYGKRVYPGDCGLAGGALDGYFRKEWQAGRCDQFAEQKQQSIDRTGRFLDRRPT